MCISGSTIVFMSEVTSVSTPDSRELFLKDILRFLESIGIERIDLKLYDSYPANDTPTHVRDSLMYTFTASIVASDEWKLAADDMKEMVTADRESTKRARMGD